MVRDVILKIYNNNVSKISTLVTPNVSEHLKRFVVTITHSSDNQESGSVGPRSRT